MKTVIKSLSLLFALILFTLTLASCDGVELGIKGDKGDTGVGIETSYVNEELHLILVLTDGTEIDAGYVGADGKDGTDGVSVESAYVNEELHLILILTDGTEIDAGYVGAEGEDGVGIETAYVNEALHLILVLTDGTEIDAGYVGAEGEDGVGIENAYVNEGLHLILVLTDGTEIDAGYVGGSTEPDITPPQTPNETISGSVINNNGNTPIANAKIEIYLDVSMTVQIETVYSDANGNYEASLPVGTYYIKITAQGFISMETSLSMNTSGTTYVETLVMVEGETGTTDTGTVSGSITNALTGHTVANVQLVVRNGWNNTDGEIVLDTSTESDGSYYLELPLGNYTVSLIKQGYIFNHINITVTLQNLIIPGTINPENGNETPTGDLRVVLTWGASPSDLDSHLIGPSADAQSNRFHVYYANKKVSSNGEKKVDLDVDDTSSYGPETTTVYSMVNGTYSFYVHNYSNKSSTSSTALASSGAKVQVYIGETLIATYHVPSNQGGTLWYVFDYDAQSGVITPINSMSYHSVPESIG